MRHNCKVPKKRFRLANITTSYGYVHFSQAYAEHPSEGITYRELYRQAYAVASFLLQKDIGHLDVCCQVLPNCVEFAPSFLGTMLTGGVSLVANGSCTQEELKQAFVDSGCKAVITNSALLHDVFAATKYCPSVKVS
ncbi:AMP-binding domain-containing protein [Trichostrongylus colubriformis]|uniref:AMP-binding domain-containing protein n=1 Tax=Trichostrongylus colubriformis TaxID=6319 RepID=A0AAN8IPZ3_TRICO